MTKALRELEKENRNTDMIIEVLDARAPHATRNPDFADTFPGKKRIIILNKADLADEKLTRAWIRFYRSGKLECIGTDARDRSTLKRLILQDLGDAPKEKAASGRAAVKKPVRAIVAGIPNAGKSTLINSLSGKAETKTGNKPGVTRGKQWISLGRSLELMDTPGILWPKFEDRETGLALAFLGCINDDILDRRELSLELIKKLNKIDPQILGSRFDCAGLSESEALDKIAKKRGCLLKGGEPDYDRASDILLKEFRNGKLGRITLEVPPADGKNTGKAEISG